MSSPADPALAATLESALGLLAEGAADPASPWHTPTLATTDAAGRPQARTVVLRRWIPATRCLEVHTDSRAGKYAELLAAPHAALHGWDPARRIQLRAQGAVSLHAGDAIARTAWHGLSFASRATYAILPGPGTTLFHPGSVTQADAQAAFAVFCVIHLACESLQWLHLEQGRHTSALFRWEQGACTSMWQVP